MEWWQKLSATISFTKNASLHGSIVRPTFFVANVLCVSYNAGLMCESYDSRATLSFYNVMGSLYSNVATIDSTKTVISSANLRSKETPETAATHVKKRLRLFLVRT